MKDFFKKILDIPIHFAIVIGVVATAMIVLTVQGEITWLLAGGLSVIAFLFVLQVHYGWVVFKSVLAVLVVIYASSIYTSAVMSIHGNIVEPFLLTIAAVTLFLSQTYNKDKLNYGIRSRVLWSSVLVLILISVKLALILSDYSFFIAEIIGLNILVVYTALWRLWVSNSNKTKMTYPKVVEEEIFNEYKFIYIEDRLNIRETKWTGGQFAGKKTNAYPYIYNEVLKAKEEGLIVIFVYTLLTNKVYDVGEIKVNKAVTIPYLYIEAKEDNYMQDALNSFAEEVSRYSK